MFDSLIEKEKEQLKQLDELMNKLIIFLNISQDTRRELVIHIHNLEMQHEANTRDSK